MSVLLYPNYRLLHPVKIVTTSTALSLVDSVVEYTGSEDATLTLSLGDYYYRGLTFYIKNSSNYLVTIVPSGSDLIEFQASQELQTGDAVTLVFTTQWRIL